MKFFNKIWIEDSFPEIWREALIVAIKKPGKSSLNPENYRPISLLSCLCKIFEKMVNRRLMWWLEDNNLFSDSQFGFRKNRSTMDNLLIFESEIQESFKKKEHLLAVLFDLKKAYDSTWRFHIFKV